MKAIRTPESNRTLVLNDSDGNRIEDGDLPAQYFLGYDTSRGESKQDARPAWETVWQPDEREARQIEAGACVKVTVWGPQHPPVSVGVTDAVVPERELIDRRHVDRALGHLYAHLRARAATQIEQTRAAWMERVGDLHDAWSADDLLEAALPDAGAFADLWLEAVNATRPPEAGGPGQQNGRPA